MSKEEKAELTEAQWDIIRIVWQEEPCAAGTVQEALQESRNWAYSTVKTTMDRMVKKGFLKVKYIRNLQLFSSCIDQKQARENEIFKAVKRAFNGAFTPMVQFLLENEQLSSKEISQLRELIDRADEKKRGR